MKSLRVGLATLLMIVAGGSASTQAAPASVARNAAIYATPGGAIIVNAPAGERLDANCDGSGWCRVLYSGVAGYMRQSDVVIGASPQPWPQPQPWPPQPQPWPPQPQPWPQPEPWPQPQPPRPPQPPVYEDSGACFYSERNFGGSSFCLEIDESLNSFRTWDNRIRSVEVFGGAEVDLCSDRNLYGNCITLRSDTARLPSQLDRRASSVEVY